jgi:hypothetical protein
MSQRLFKDGERVAWADFDDDTEDARRIDYYKVLYGRTVYVVYLGEEGVDGVWRYVITSNGLTLKTVRTRQDRRPVPTDTSALFLEKYLRSVEKGTVS